MLLAVIAQSVERAPFKRVVLGSSPSNGTALLAQSVERAPFKRVVVGSIPTQGTISVSSVGRASVL